MLRQANPFQDEISNALIDTWYKEKYKYYYYTDYRSGFELPDGDWDARHFVSLDKNGKLIGYICYEVYRNSNMACGFGAINFTESKAIFGKDLAQVIDDIFCKFNHNKIEFSVVIGNPIEKSYDRMVHKYGGRIIGVRHQHTVLIDNQYYDEKLYEIMREDYIKAKNKRKKLFPRINKRRI